MPLHTVANLTVETFNRSTTGLELCLMSNQNFVYKQQDTQLKKSAVMASQLSMRIKLSQIVRADNINIFERSF